MLAEIPPPVKRELAMDGIVEPGRGLLAHVALAVNDLLPAPEMFVWSMIPGTPEARIWMLVELDEARIEPLAAALRRVPGVRGVQVRLPGELIRLPSPEPRP